jgi:hypothetical protein
MSTELADLARLVDAHPDIFDVGVPASPDAITAAERFLGVEFPASFVEYLACWGNLAVGPLEFYGIAGSDFEDGSIPDGVWFTHVKRQEIGLPKPLVIVLNNDGDEFYCVDTTHTGGRVVVWDVCSRAIVSVKGDNVCRLILQEANDWLKDS